MYFQNQKYLGHDTHTQSNKKAAQEKKRRKGEQQHGGGKMRTQKNQSVPTYIYLEKIKRECSQDEQRY